MRHQNSQIGPLTDEERKEIFSRSPIKGVYEEAIDRESAYEVLLEKEKERIKKQEAEAGGKRKSLN